MAKALRSSIKGSLKSSINPGLLALSVWTPSELGSNLKLWLDADDLATITVSGSSVSQWDDKSGNNNHAVQGTSSNQFLSGTRTLNSRNVLEAVSNDFMIANFDPLLAAQPTTILGVVGFDDTGVDNSFIDGDGDNRILLRRVSLNRTVIWAGTFLTNFDTVANDTILFTALANTTATELSVNGGTPATGNIGTRQLSNKARIANNDGIWAELLIYEGAMSASEQDKAGGYLAHRWGLAANLPSDHPYKSSAPTV